MAFYMKPGQGPKMKTGNGLPSGLMGGPKMKPCGGPMMHEGDGKKHSEDEPIPAASKLEAEKDKKKMPKIMAVKTDAPKKIMKVKTDAPKKIMAVKTNAPKTPSKTGKKRHPGFDQSYYGKGFQAAQGDSSGVANVLNEREYNKGKKRQEAYENTNPFPTQGQELKGRLKKYKVKSIDSKTGDYVINKIGGFSNENNRNVTRREMQQSLRHNTYEVPKR